MSIIIDNAKIVELEPDIGLVEYMNRAMPSPGFANTSWLRSNELYYVPFIGNGVLEYTGKIFSEWRLSFENGLTLYEDCFEEDVSLSPMQRFRNPMKVCFNTHDDFSNGGFLGRIFIFMGPTEFIYFDVLETSGICTTANRVRNLLGHSLHMHLLELDQEARKIEDFRERRYYQRLIENSEADNGDSLLNS